ncbi:MAG: oligosaccharide flippase family protein [Anaerolineales bacterium]|nr:oligosaccharide flippase family protein [Anaerolineales bacterium]
MSLVRRSITSTGWNAAANVLSLVVLFARSVLLARMLPVAVFGAYRQAGSLISLTVVLTGFGMPGAFLHRAPETADEEQAAAVLFTLKLLFTLFWLALMVTATLLFAEGDLRLALLWLLTTSTGMQLTETPRSILRRRVVHRRLAMVQTFTAVGTTIAALLWAWLSPSLLALLVTDVVAVLIALFLLYGYRPVWRPRLSLDRPTVRYFLDFGRRNFMASFLVQALDRVDDVWTGFYLGERPLGFYSRAYTFATYPRQILAVPVNTVAVGTYAELSDDRRRLSQAFFRTNALLVRTGFILGGVLALIAPEFIRLLLGDKWLPMLDAFRLMLLYTLLDPIKGTVANLFIAVGKPEYIVRARLAQLAVMLAGLVLLGPPLGIVGVALAVNLMLLVGIVLLLWQSRPFVDFNAWRLFAAPLLALLVGMGGAWAASQLPAVAGSDWRTGAVKLVVFGLVYGAILFLLERRQMLDMIAMLRRQLRRS